MTELGLRYRPLATADQEDHQAGVLILARDLDGIQPAKIAAAAEQWARSQRFMPKACDLIALIAKLPASKRSQHDICDEANSRLLADPDGRRDVHWVVVNGQAKMEFIR